MADAKVEAFILFNEHENGVKAVVEALDAAGVTTYFWRRDIEIGERWGEIEAQKLREAVAILIFLGEKGWGPNHIRLTREALDLNKRIIPVLVGDVPEAALGEADGLFRHKRYIEVREPNPESIETLVQAIRRPEPSRSAKVENLLRTLIDGSETERAEALRQIREARTLDRRELARRLREEITTGYAPSTESNFASSRLSPKLVSSVRSWMLSSLIWADAESAESRELLKKHVSNYEPDRNVRFWTLAGLWQVKASYVDDAVKVAQRDNEPEVTSLAQVAALPADEKVVGELRKRIRSGDFETAWPALRVLRVIPLPHLAADVCDQLNDHPPGTPFSYDALYALSHPDMAAAAAPVLEKNPGLGDVVERIVAEASTSNSNGARNFAVLLAALDAEGVNHALESAHGAPERRDVVRRLRRHLADLRSRGETAGSFLAGYTPDTINVADDRLDIRVDVQTLTAIMLAKGVTPPLAIGLFGDWGSGKSFFMRSMRAAAEELSTRAAASPTSAFCSNIVSIEFNAWHYVDTNLWASLVSYILERLEAYVAPKQSDEETQSALVKELSSAQAILAEAESEKKRAEQLITDRQQELQNLKLQREQKEVELRELRLHDLKELLSAEEKQELKESLDEIGVPAALNSVSDLSRVVSEAYTVRGRANALFAVLADRKNRWLLWLLMAFVLVGVPLATYLARRYAGDFMATAAGLVAQFVAVAGVVTAALSRALGHVKAGLTVLEGARQKAEERLAEKRKNPTGREVELQKEIVKLSAQEEEAASRLAAAAARVQQLEERIRSISEGKSLARFLAERTSSEDYRKHLGLISTVRRDFEILSTRLAAGQDGTGSGLRRVDRIILYIDDLDRCPADKVMDVLQAVHLLLAYPLFVVVVGVDPRWLLHSLGKSYSAFEGEGKHFSADPDIWRTTPQNYLEKIFQIPFTLRPMSADGYGRLIEKLFSPDLAPDSQAAPQPGKNGAPRKAGGAHDVDAERKSKTPPSQDEHTSEDEHSMRSTDPESLSMPREPREGRANAQPPAADFVVHEESLVIRPWESSFAERLFALIPTPRAAKRFSNTYRILKATVHNQRLAQFEGTSQLPGDFQIPMLLLAIVIGSPAEAEALFPLLLQRAARNGDVVEVLLNFKLLGLGSAPYLALEEKIKPIVSDEGFPNNAGEFSTWISRVSRFSFEIGRAVQLNNPT
jgi:hypothetical protein